MRTLLMAGLALAVAERHRRLTDLVLPRVAVWGALGGLALPWLGGAPGAMTLILAVQGAATMKFMLDASPSPKIRGIQMLVGG